MMFVCRMDFNPLPRDELREAALSRQYSRRRMAHVRLGVLPLVRDSELSSPCVRPFLFLGRPDFHDVLETAERQAGPFE